MEGQRFVEEEGMLNKSNSWIRGTKMKFVGICCSLVLVLGLGISGAEGQVKRKTTEYRGVLPEKVLSVYQDAYRRAGFQLGRKEVSGKSLTIFDFRLPDRTDPARRYGVVSVTVALVDEGDGRYCRLWQSAAGVVGFPNMDDEYSGMQYLTLAAEDVALKEVKSKLGKAPEYQDAFRYSGIRAEKVISTFTKAYRRVGLEPNQKTLRATAGEKRVIVLEFRPRGPEPPGYPYGFVSLVLVAPANGECSPCQLWRNSYGNAFFRFGDGVRKIDTLTREADKQALDEVKSVLGDAPPALLDVRIDVPHRGKRDDDDID
jgi:hypothetical protein